MASSIFNNTGTVIAEYFDQKGLEVIAKSNTPISKLITLKNEYEPPSEELTGFDAMMDDFVNSIGKDVLSHIAYAKNVVVPEIKALADTMRANMERLNIKNPETSITLTYLEIPKVFSNEHLINELNEFKGLPNPNSEVNDLDLSPFTIDELLAYTIVGNDSLDKDVLDFIGSVGEEDIERFIRDPKSAMQTGLHNADAACATLILYLLYKGLSIKNDLNVGLSASSLLSVTSSLRFKYGVQAYEAMRHVLNAQKHGKIFDKLDQKTLTATVFKDNFISFSEAGGSVELLYGAIVSPKMWFFSNNSTEYLLKNKQEYEHTWNTYRYLKTAEITGQKLSIFKVLLTDAFIDSLNVRNETEEESIKDIINYRQTVDKLFNEYLHTIKTLDVDIDTDNFNDIILHVVAKIRFFFTGSYEILTSINKYMRFDSKLNIREAALLAGSDYVADYIASQLALVR